MRLALRFIAAVLILIGAVWTLQGVNLLAGSRMSGDTFWAGTGLVLLVVGVGLGAATVVHRGGSRT